MTLTDLTLVAPLNELLTLTGLPRVGLEQLAVAQLALIGGDRALAALPMRRRRRGGGIGILGLCCCLVPLAALALGAYLLWARQKGKDPRTALGDIRSTVVGNSSQTSHQAPPPPGAGHQAPPPPASGGGQASTDQASTPPASERPAPPPPPSDRPAPPPPPGESPLDPPSQS